MCVCIYICKYIRNLQRQGGAKNTAQQRQQIASSCMYLCVCVYVRVCLCVYKRKKTSETRRRDRHGTVQAPKCSILPCNNVCALGSTRLGSDLRYKRDKSVKKRRMYVERALYKRPVNETRKRDSILPCGNCVKRDVCMQKEACKRDL